MSEPLPEPVTLEEALAHHFEERGIGHGRTRYGDKLAELVEEHGKVLRVKRIGGVDQDWQIIARVSIEICALNHDDLWDGAEDIAKELMKFPFRASRWRVDRVVSESAAKELPNRDQKVRVAESTWRITVRPPAA